MAIAALNLTLLTYTRSKANMVSKLNTITSKIVIATQNNMQITENMLEKRRYYEDKVALNPSYADTTEYKNLVKAIEDDYKFQLKKINAWEAQLNMEKNSLETQIKTMTGYEEGLVAALKEKTKKDFTFGDMGK